RRSHLFVSGVRVAVVAVDSRNRCMARAANIFESQDKRLGSAWLTWRNKVPHSYDQRTIRNSRHQRRIGIQCEAFVTKPVQKFERRERRLGNSSRGNQAVATIERLFHHALLFKDVG